MNNKGKGSGLMLIIILIVAVIIAYLVVTQMGSLGVSKQKRGSRHSKMPWMRRRTLWMRSMRG